MAPRQDPNGVARGVALIVATAFMISAQDLVFKLFAGALTLWQIFALRGLLTLPMLMGPMLMGPGLARGQGAGTLRAALSRWPLLRALCLTMTFLAFYGAIPFLSLSTVGAANYIAPVFVALLSAYVIGERVGPQGWIGVSLGFAGVVVLLRPGSDAFQAFVLLPVAGAALYAVGHVITRTRCQEVPVAALSLSVNAVMLLAGVLVSAALWAWPQAGAAAEYPYLFGPWSPVSATDGLVLVLLAGFAVVNGLMLAGANKIAPPATVATFEYSYLIFVAAWDVLVFGSAPTWMSQIGMAMIVAAGLLVTRARRDRRPGAPQRGDAPRRSVVQRARPAMIRPCHWAAGAAWATRSARSWRDLRSA